MAKYKITRVYVVEAGGPLAARDELRIAEEQRHLLKYLEYESLKGVEEPKKGWVKTLREQVAGK